MNPKKNLIKSKSKKLIIKQQFQLPPNFESKVLYLEELLNCGKLTLDLLHELLELYTVNYDYKIFKKAASYYESKDNMVLLQMYMDKIQKLFLNERVMNLLDRNTEVEFHDSVTPRNNNVKISFEDNFPQTTRNYDYKPVLTSGNYELKNRPTFTNLPMNKENLKAIIKEKQKEHKEMAKNMIAAFKMSLDKPKAFDSELENQGVSFRRRLEMKKLTKAQTQQSLKVVQQNINHSKERVSHEVFYFFTFIIEVEYSETSKKRINLFGKMEVR